MVNSEFSTNITVFKEPWCVSALITSKWCSSSVCLPRALDYYKFYMYIIQCQLHKDPYVVSTHISPPGRKSQRGKVISWSLFRELSLNFLITPCGVLYDFPVNCAQLPLSLCPSLSFYDLYIPLGRLKDVPTVCPSLCTQSTVCVQCFTWRVCIRQLCLCFYAAGVGQR